MIKNIKLLSSRDAVLAAIAESDKLGRDVFLRTYGYKRSRKYPLVFNGQEYDSKAIAGVAYGIEFNTTMTAYDHSGGVNFCVPVLQKMGFDVKDAPNADTDSVVKEQRNPSWNRDELLLALHLYLNNRQTPPGKTSAQLIELSDLLGKMSTKSDLGKTYRNPSGVYMKLMNFRSYDPLYTVTGKVGLTRGNKDEQVVWDLYAHRLEYLGSLVTIIKAAVDFDDDETGIGEDDEEGIEDCEEGRILTRMHRYRERSRKLATEFKKQYRKRHGKLECAGCDLDFAINYGEISDSLIDVHHTKPVHTLQPGEKTSPKDLVLLCVSCHRAVHAKKMWLSIIQLRQQLGKKN
jgi:5-methylcytosine-specific restriction protein A